MPSHHHFQKVLDCLFRRWVEGTAADVDLSSKLICDHDNRRVLSLLGRSKPAQEVDRHDLPRMPSNNRVDVDAVRQFVSCPLTYVTRPHEILHIFTHPHPPEMLPKPLCRLLDAEVSHKRCFIAFANDFGTQFRITRYPHTFP